jgi:hypothetical protein
MVLDEMYLREFAWCNSKSISQGTPDIVYFLQVSRAIDDVGETHAVTDRKGGLAEEIRFGIAADCDVCDIHSLDAANLETFRNGTGRKAGPVFDALKPFLLDRGNERTVLKKDCGSVCVVGVDSQDVHALTGVLNA